eukprot:1161371-Pelagomonas_calceolata.AAC.10
MSYQECYQQFLSAGRSYCMCSSDCHQSKRSKQKGGKNRGGVSMKRTGRKCQQPSPSSSLSPNLRDCPSGRGESAEVTTNLLGMGEAPMVCSAEQESEAPYKLGRKGTGDTAVPAHRAA